MNKQIIITAAAFLIRLISAGQSLPLEDSLTDSRIMQRINGSRPLRGGIIPHDIAERLGATHTSGKYFLSDHPYLEEGAVKLDSLGFGILKLWFYKTPQNSYPYHADWNLKNRLTLKDLAAHSYYKEAFALPFSTIVLSTSALQSRTLWKLSEKDLRQEEDELYELCSFLLETYKSRNVKFIIQNWEGDWIYRGGVEAGSQWKREAIPADTAERSKGMIAWFKVRQRAVDRARKDNPDSRSRIYHAVEVNKVLDCMKGIPGLVTNVLPHLDVDLVSWSCYDGLDRTGLKLYKGIGYIRQHIRHGDTRNTQVFIGEIGIPENVSYNGDAAAITDAWDAYMGVLLDLNVPYIIQWELYCNEAKDGSKGFYPVRTAEQMRGFWLLKPDGTAGIALKYFEELLKNAGSGLQDK